MKYLGWMWAILAIGWLLGSLILNLKNGGTLPDFRVDYRAAEVVIARKNLYIDTQGEYWYPGSSIVWFVPFLIFDIQTSEKMWTTLSLLLFLVSIIFWARLVGTKRRDMGWIIGASATMFPAKFTLGMGQINNLILFLLVLTIWYLKRKNEIKSGFFLGLAFLIKLLPGLWLVYFCLRGKRQLAFLATSVIMIGTLVWCGLWKSYLEIAIPRMGSVFASTSYYNQGLAGTLGRLWMGKETNLILGTVFILTVFVWVIVKPGTMIGDACFLLVAEVISRGVVWQHHLILLIPPLIWLWRKSKSWSKALVFIAYSLLALNIKDPMGINNVFVLSHGFIGAVIVLLMTGRVRFEV